MKRWRWNQMKRPLPTLIVAIQGTSLIIRNLPFVQFPPKADRGPIPDRQLFGTDGGIAAICPVAVGVTATDPHCRRSSRS